jgi:hypothetical protein
MLNREWAVTMPRKLRHLRASLRKAGFDIARQEGSHEICTHPLVSGVGANLAGKVSDDAHRYQEAQVHEALRKLREAERALKSQQQQQKGQQTP